MTPFRKYRVSVFSDSPSRQYSGHSKAAVEKDDRGTRGKEICRRKRGLPVTGSVGGQLRRWPKIELNGDYWSVTYDLLGATSHCYIRDFVGVVVVVGVVVEVVVVVVDVVVDGVVVVVVSLAVSTHVMLRSCCKTLFSCVKCDT